MKRNIDLSPEDILLPQLYGNRKRKRIRRRVRNFSRIIFLVAVIFVFVYKFSDIGGNIILNLAQKDLRENHNLSLTTESITGNPIRGYTFHNFTIIDNEGHEVMRGETFSGRVNFWELLAGRIRMSNISVHSVSIDAGREDFALWVNEFRVNMRNYYAYIDAELNSIPLRGSIDLADMTTIDRAALDFGTGKLLATGGINGGTIDFHVSGESIDIREMHSLIRHNVKGRANFTADITGTMDSLRAFGTADITGAEVYGFPVERVSANMNFSDGRLHINDIQASALNVPLQGEITILYGKDEKPSMILKVDGTEATLDGLDKILGIPELHSLKGKISEFTANLSGYVDSLSGLMNITAPRVAYDSRTITDVRAQLKLSGNNRAKVDGKFTFEGAHGYLQGTITPLSVDVTANVADIDFERVEYMIESADAFRDAKKVSAVLTVKGRINSPDITGTFTKGGI